ncbi:hypothetical protein GKZ68_08805 [Hymenobacter sp. BRD128]|uniref:hypothetical protein n=1 Tax=Hymenobacter sp. BRD128 TaxID=2675878 RepID=UPI0015663155|nr:hypothetical protein [Hymenobacter sp. BRD128]QKG56712.1 hypothetical protein GKZ68_08805 [Hymenobacter sp. BRD128]
MVRVQQQEDTVVFTVEGWHKLWAFRSELRIPRAHIKNARADPEAAAHWAGLRAGGTYVPGLITAGTFYLDGLVDHKPTFFDVQHRENTVVVELADEQYARLIIEVENPAAVVALLNGLAAAPR